MMEKKWKIILITSLAANVIVLLVGGYMLLMKDKGKGLVTNFPYGVNRQSSVFKQEAHYKNRVSLFETIPIQSNNIVFLGDSMTQRGAWSELLENNAIVNRGIDGDKTEGVLKRIEQVTNHPPKKLFLMIGVNDINRKVPESTTVANYRKIFTKLKEEAPETKVYVQSLLPVNYTTFQHGADNKKINSLNQNLEAICKEMNITYIDLHHLFLKNNELNEKYTNDGIHLNGSGYQIWKNAIAKYVEEK